MRPLRLLNIRILQQMQLWCRSSVDTKFHSTGRHYEKTLHSKTSSYRACSEINVIQPKCWRDKLNVELSFYELSVFTNVIFNVVDSSAKSNASVNVVAVKEKCRVQCENKQLQLLKDCPDNLKAADLMLKVNPKENKTGK